MAKFGLFSLIMGPQVFVRLSTSVW